MRFKVFRTINLINLLIALAVFGYVAEEIWQRKIEPKIVKTADVHSFEILTTKIYPGDPIKYRVLYSKYRPVPGLAIKEAVAVDSSGDEYSLMSDVTNMETGRNILSVRELMSPYNMKPNIYRIRATWEWPPINSKTPPVTLKVYSSNTFTVMRFVNQQFEKGEQGIQGKQGVQGIEGKQGPPGVAGPRGAGHD